MQFEAVFKFNPNHDPASGQFAGADGGTTYSPNAKAVGKLAGGLLKAAAAAEPKVTSALQSSLPEGASLYGLDYRLKGADSLERKIRDEAKVERRPVEAVAADIRDSLRYTVILPTDSYRSGAADVQKALQDAGFTQFKNSDYWKDGDGVYKGINSAFKKGDLKFEVQFHTAESQSLKTRNHSLYEQARLLTTPPELRKKLLEMMKEHAKHVTMPR